MEELGKEHRWLEQLVGEWSVVTEAIVAPGEEPTLDESTESGKSLDGVWVVMEGQGSMGGDPYRSMMTLGYDPEKGHYVGSFVSTMMPQLWVYDGQMDAAGRLVLESEGPSFEEEGARTMYRDTIEFENDDVRVMRSTYLDGQGNWQNFMTTTYTRVR